MKSSKQETKEQNKVFEKKVKEYEKKIVELNAFREKKLFEEREEKLRKKKELKKARKNNMKKFVDPKTNPEHETTVSLLEVCDAESREAICEIKEKKVDLYLNHEPLAKKQTENLEVESNTDLNSEPEVKPASAVYETDPNENPTDSTVHSFRKEDAVIDENDFPEEFKNWSEEQKKEAHDKNFKFYVEKYLAGLNL